MTAELSPADLLDALTGHEITVRPTDDYMGIAGASSLPEDARATLIDWKEHQPEQRRALMATVWQMGKPEPVTPEDAARCPACPHRGKGALYVMGGEAVVCDCRCPQGQEVKVMP